MNSIWNKNLSLLRERFPQLYQLLEADLSAALETATASDSDGGGNSGPEFSCGWKLVRARSGDWTAEPSLHSRYDPVKEAGRLAESLLQGLESDSKVPVFMGFGLGYGVQALARRMQSQGNRSPAGLVLVEPDVACLAAALWSVDFESVFSLERCALLVGASHQSVLGVLESFGLGKCHIIWNRTHTSHHQQYFDGLQTLIQRNLEKDDINDRTLEKFGRLWLRNSCRNLHFLAECDAVARYENFGWNLDACVVGAGPSLDLVLPHLAAIKERSLVIAVDTALRSCLRVGVEPDFVVLSDPQYWNARHLSGLCAPSTTLVTEVAAYPSVFRFPCREIVLCSSLYPVGRFFSTRGLDKGDLGAGGSVATSAWGLARLCGCHRIFLAAVDLSFPGKRTHARGSTFEEKTHIASTRLNPSQQSQTAALFSAATTLKTSYSGHSVLTDQRMELYAWWFESKVAAHPEVKTYSLTSESLSIPGISHFPLEEFLAQPSRLQQREEFAGLQDAARTSFQEKTAQMAAQFRSARMDLQEGLHQLYKTARRGMGLCRDTLALQDGSTFESAYGRVSSQLAAVDHALLSSPFHDAASLAFPTQRQLEKLYADTSFSQNPWRASLEKSRILYQKLLAALAEYNQFLD